MAPSTDSGRFGGLFAGPFQTGYRQYPFIVNRLFNIILCVFLLICALPFFIVLMVVIRIVEGPPIFYRGERLGKNKKIFMMYKFRTLVPNAQQITGARMLTEKMKLMTHTGKFLRDSRLDELPQLFNVLRGDMDFIGPRPERPEVYEKICRFIKGYDHRFRVKPGMIGYSQLFTPHGTPKRIRTLIDNYLISRKQKPLGDFFLVSFTVGIVLRKTLSLVWNEAKRKLTPSNGAEKRVLERVDLKKARVYGFWENRQGEKALEGRVLDMNDEAFRVNTPLDFNGSFPACFKMEIEVNRRGRRLVKRAWCKGELFRKLPPKKNGSYDYVIRYEAASSLNYYIIQQYFMRRSMA